MSHVPHNKPQLAIHTGNRLVLAILGISFVMGAVLTLTVIKMDISVHPAALAAPQTANAQEVRAVNIEQPSTETVPAARIIVMIDNLVVTLDEPQAPRYLKVSFSVEAPSISIEEELELRKIEIRDTLIPYLSSLSLRQTQGFRAKKRIRTQARVLINSVLKSGSVDRVFISDFITQ